MKSQTLARRIELLERRNGRRMQPMTVRIYGALTDTDAPETEHRTLANGRQLTVVRYAQTPANA